VGLKLAKVELRHKIYCFRGEILDKDKSLMDFECPKGARRISPNMFVYSEVGGSNDVSTENFCDLVDAKLNRVCLKVVGSRSSRRNAKRKLSPKKLELLQQEGELWHCMGHISYPLLNKFKMVTQNVGDLICTKTITNCVC